MSRNEYFPWELPRSGATSVMIVNRGNMGEVCVLFVTLSYAPGASGAGKTPYLIILFRATKGPHRPIGNAAHHLGFNLTDRNLNQRDEFCDKFSQSCPGKPESYPDFKE